MDKERRKRRHIPQVQAYWDLRSSGGLGFALGVMAVARDFHGASRVVAVVAAVFLAVLDQAVARGVRAFLFSSAVTHASFRSSVSSWATETPAGIWPRTEDHTPASAGFQTRLANAARYEW